MDASIQEPEAPPRDTEPLLVTAEHAATSLSICRTKVYELLRNGELESVRIGSKPPHPGRRFGPVRRAAAGWTNNSRRMRGRCIRPFSGRGGATETANWETWTWPRGAEGRARVRLPPA